MNGKIYAIMVDDNQTSSGYMVATDDETKEELIFTTEEDAREYIHEQEEEFQDYGNAVTIRELDIKEDAKGLYDGGWRAEDVDLLITEHGPTIGKMLAEALGEIEEEAA